MNTLFVTRNISSFKIYIATTEIFIFCTTRICHFPVPYSQTYDHKHLYKSHKPTYTFRSGITLKKCKNFCVFYVVWSTTTYSVNCRIVDIFSFKLIFCITSAKTTSLRKYYSCIKEITSLVKSWNKWYNFNYNKRHGWLL